MIKINLKNKNIDECFPFNYDYTKEIKKMMKIQNKIENKCLKVFKKYPPIIINQYKEDYWCVEYTEQSIVRNKKYIHHYSYGDDMYSIERLEDNGNNKIKTI